MKRTAGITRIVVAAAVLMSGALATTGATRLASIGQILPRMPRTAQEEMAHVQKDSASPAIARDLTIIARGRSEETDPCIPNAPVAFSTRPAMMC
jgi:hypothetical protein